MKHLFVKGFTLIELMIVIAIIAILAAIAIPAYQGYTARAQLSEAFVNFDAAKTAIEAYIQGGGDKTHEINNSTVGLADSISGEYVSAVLVSGFPNSEVTVEATISANAASGAGGIIWSGVPNNNGVITWVCHSTLPQKYLPASCTTIPPVNPMRSIPHSIAP